MSAFADQAADFICPLPLLEKVAAAVTYEEVETLDKQKEEEEDRKSSRRRNAILGTLAGIAGLAGAGYLGYHGHKKGWWDPVYDLFKGEGGMRNEPVPFRQAMRKVRDWTWAPGGVAALANLGVGTTGIQRRLPKRVRDFLRSTRILSGTKDVIGMDDLADFIRRRGTPAAQSLEEQSVKAPKAVRRSGKEEAVLQDLYSILEGRPGSSAALSRELKRVLQPGAESQFKKFIRDPDVSFIPEDALNSAIKSRERALKSAKRPETRARITDELDTLRKVMADPGSAGVEVLNTNQMRKLLTQVPTAQKRAIYNPKRWIQPFAQRADVRIIDDTVSGMRRTAALLNTSPANPVAKLRQSEAVGRIRKSLDEAGLTTPGQKYSNRRLATIVDTVADGLESIKAQQGLSIGRGIGRAAAVPIITQLLPWAAETFLPEAWVSPEQWVE